jgi:hypothetical protein
MYCGWWSITSARCCARCAPVQLTGLDEVLALYENVDEAMAGARMSPFPEG